jgi:prepilin-type N-terminal cleavage/methylation domain-containing protein
MAEPRTYVNLPRLRIARSGRGAAAFSMIEMVVVLFIMGIMAAVALPRFSGTLENQRVDGAARRIASDLEQAARAAAASSSSSSIEYYVGAKNNYYLMTGRPDPDHPSQTYAVRLNRLYDGVVLEKVDFAGKSQITFNGFGVPASGGDIIVRSGTTQRRISLDAATGKVTVSN